MPIRQLSPLVVSQIAAGEVIERPASVVKELVENAIDAGSTRIDVAIESGGADLIRVTDNGSGIAFDDMPLALAPHATSKIRSTEDLDAIATMGFRGEALASIASVSRLVLVSRPRDQTEGRMIEAEGDRIGAPAPIGAPVGTTITVRTVFFNTPARRKFLRGEQTESGRVTEVIHALAMSHPSIAFALTQDGRTTIELPADQTPRERVLALLGPELEPELLEVNASEGSLQIWGLAGTPGIARGTARQLRLYLNGRPISDRSLNHAMKEAYRGLIDPARYPVVVLFLEIDPSQVDVNVHPAKLEVRFRNQAVIHGAVFSAVRAALRAADLTPALALDRAAPPSSAPFLPAFPAFVATPGASGSVPSQTREAASSSSAAASAVAQPSSSQFVEYFHRLDPTQKGFVYAEVKQALARDLPELVAGASRSATLDRDDALPTVRAVQDALQVHCCYIVTQDEQGLLIIDQHALHERVLFEKLREQIGRGNLESQRMLMPVMIELQPRRIEALASLAPLLKRVGIEAEQAGPRSIAVHAFSSLLFERRVDPREFLTELLDKAASGAGAGDAEAALHQTLDMMACKAAVKAGDRLAPAEIADLLRHRDLVERSSNCPHGRPTTLRLTLRDLDRQFGRA